MPVAGCSGRARRRGGFREASVPPNVGIAEVEAGSSQGLDFFVAIGAACGIEA